MSVSLAKLEPTSFTQASKYSHKKEEMAKEYNALLSNGT